MVTTGNASKDLTKAAIEWLLLRGFTVEKKKRVPELVESSEKSEIGEEEEEERNETEDIGDSDSSVSVPAASPVRGDFKVVTREERELERVKTAAARDELLRKMEEKEALKFGWRAEQSAEPSTSTGRQTSKSTTPRTAKKPKEVEKDVSQLTRDLRRGRGQASGEETVESYTEGEDAVASDGLSQESTEPEEDATSGKVKSSGMSSTQYFMRERKKREQRAQQKKAEAIQSVSTAKSTTKTSKKGVTPGRQTVGQKEPKNFEALKAARAAKQLKKSESPSGQDEKDASKRKAEDTVSIEVLVIESLSR